MGVNIDGQGQQQAEEAIQHQPHPNIFLIQQQQVFEFSLKIITFKPKLISLVITCQLILYSAWHAYCFLSSSSCMRRMSNVDSPVYPVLEQQCYLYWWQCSDLKFNFSFRLYQQTTCCKSVVFDAETKQLQKNENAIN